MLHPNPGAQVKPLLQILIILGLCRVLAAADTPSTPGEHKKQQCAVVGQTFDLFLPKAYADKPEKKFPSIYISGPHKNPGFRKLQAWAEKNEVILITINESQNGYWDPIFKAQDSVLEATAYLRLHPNLRFSLGFSGGAAASLELAKRKSMDFSGCVLHCHMGDVEAVPRHLALAFIAGEKDSAQPPKFIRRSIESTENSNFVQSHFFPNGGHDWHDGEIQEEFLNAMLLYATLVHPGIDKKDKKRALDELGKKLDDKNPDQKTVEIWCKAKAEQILDSGKGIDAYKLIMEEKTLARLQLAKGSKVAVDKAITPILDNPNLSQEIAAYTAYRAISDSGNADVDVTRYSKIHEAYPSTWAAELAQAAIERLKKSLKN
jgi:predicted esterase